MGSHCPSVFIGKLSPSIAEVLILDVDGTIVARPHGEAQVVHSHDDSDAPPSHLIGSDLHVVDLPSDDECHEGSYTIPGPQDGRRLMKARSRQCVVCLDEKEHTFVPPHRRHLVQCCAEEEQGQDASGPVLLGRPLSGCFGSCGGSACGRNSACSTTAGTSALAAQRRQVAIAEQHRIHSHCFCTDCWVEFLMHELSDRPKCSTGVQKPRVLCCPCCREAIGVPDVWRKQLGIAKVQPQHRYACFSPFEARPWQGSSTWVRLELESAHKPGLYAPRRLPSRHADGPCSEGGDGSSGAADHWAEQYWAVRRPGPGSLRAAANCPGGPPMLPAAVPVPPDGWVVSLFAHRAALGVALCRRLVELALFILMYFFVLLGVAHVVGFVAGDERHTGFGPLLSWASHVMFVSIAEWLPDFDFVNVDGFGD